MCPKCGATEDHPHDRTKILIRACKLFDDKGAWSQCLVCSGFYDKDLSETPENHNPEKGWFVERMPAW